MRKAIVIGATSGIGRIVASQLVKDGWKVGISGRRLELLQSFQSEEGSENVLYRQMDVTDASSVDALSSLIDELGAPDLFLYVPGVGHQNRELNIDIETNTVRTNCEGMVRMVDSFLNYARKSSAYTKEHPAHIAVVTSVAGTKGIGTAPAYSATKKMGSTYISALVQLCRMEKIPVRFTDVRPGFVATDILNPEKHYPMMMTKQDAARHIIKGLYKKKRVIIFDYRYKILVFFWKLIPNYVWERLTFVKN